MTAATLHQFEPGLSESEYRAERERIRQTYGDSKRAASAHFDQALAELFVRSNWTQERLAEVEKQSRIWVTCHLRFGAFLEFVTPVTNPEFAHVCDTLTEGKFRGYWEQTADLGNYPKPRFAAVQQALIVNHAHKNQPKDLGRAIAQLADGQWHYEKTIIAHVQKVCAALDTPIPVTDTDVLAVLGGILKFGWHGVTAEKQKGAKGYRYRFVPKRRTMDADRFLHEVEPLFAELEDQVTRPLALQSLTRVKELMHLIRELAERSATATRAPRTRGPARQENV